jgi:hypothetical protein
MLVNDKRLTAHEPRPCWAAARTALLAMREKAYFIVMMEDALM